ncbi:hypothetical protein [Rothia terrae]|uniref:Uncharacterized protein n=1 Tax=Rothia terrae TaxID=396015 RepID=A0A7H2BC23_9MICC|nr:hypothetical protein [Rothia terrae]QNV37219.1 hypothetical protein IDM49_08180 [Rothia terrae]
MKTRYIPRFPVKCRLKLVYLYFLLALALAAGMCTVAVMTDGASALWTRCWGWYLLVFLAWQVLVHPHVVLNETRIEIINPFHTHMIDYETYSKVLPVAQNTNPRTTEKTRPYKPSGLRNPECKIRHVLI